MEMTIDFPGGARVDAHFGDFVVATDQPPSGGGEGSAPTPLATFLSTIGTCAGIYVLGFCRQRGLPTEGIRLVQKMQVDPTTHLVDRCAGHDRAAGGLPGQVRRCGRSLGRAVRREEALRAPAGHPREQRPRRLSTAGPGRPRSTARSSRDNRRRSSSDRRPRRADGAGQGRPADPDKGRSPVATTGRWLEGGPNPPPSLHAPSIGDPRSDMTMSPSPNVFGRPSPLRVGATVQRQPR